MFTVIKASKIMGVDVDCFLSTPDRSKYIAEANIETGALSVSGATKSEALQSLVETCYRERCRIVFKSQGWKCKACGGILPLQGNHITMRSHGRDDSIQNLEGLCAECHERFHRNRKGPLCQTKG